MYTDNGKNFVGASRELEEMRSLFASSEYRDVLAEGLAKGILQCLFILANSPHFEGLWEAAVKSLISSSKTI